MKFEICVSDGGVLKLVGIGTAVHSVSFWATPKEAHDWHYAKASSPECIEQPGTIVLRARALPPQRRTRFSLGCGVLKVGLAVCRPVKRSRARPAHRRQQWAELVGGLVGMPALAAARTAWASIAPAHGLECHSSLADSATVPCACPMDGTCTWAHNMPITWQPGSLAASLSNHHPLCLPAFRRACRTMRPWHGSMGLPWAEWPRKTWQWPSQTRARSDRGTTLGVGCAQGMPLQRMSPWQQERTPCQLPLCHLIP